MCRLWVAITTARRILTFHFCANFVNRTCSFRRSQMCGVSLRLFVSPSCLALARWAGWSAGQVGLNVKCSQTRDWLSNFKIINLYYWSELLWLCVSHAVAAWLVTGRRVVENGRHTGQIGKGGSLHCGCDAARSSVLYRTSSWHENDHKGRSR